MNEWINKFILAKISCLVGKHMGSEIQVSGAQMQALHLLAVASGKVGFAICLTGWNGAGNLSRDCLSHGKSPSKPLDCFKAASFLSLCYRSITKRHRLTFFSSKGGKLDHYRNWWRKEERQHAIVFAEFLLNTQFLLWLWYPCSNRNILMPHWTEKECGCRDGGKRMDVICPRAHCLWAHGWDECASTSRLHTLLVKELEMPAVFMKFSKRVHVQDSKSGWDVGASELRFWSGPSLPQADGRQTHHLKVSAQLLLLCVSSLTEWQTQDSLALKKNP